MVHALGEIRRVLRSEGLLIDLRPVEDHWAVEVEDAKNVQRAGYLTDMPVGIADDAAAFTAMQEAQARGWFKQQKQQEFPFYYYWDTPSEMKEFLETEWEDFEKMDDEVYRVVRGMWAGANADARIRVRVKMMIALWTKPEP